MKTVLAMILAIAAVMMSFAYAETVAAGTYTVDLPDEMYSYGINGETQGLLGCWGSDSLELQMYYDYPPDEDGTPEIYAENYAKDVGSEVEYTTYNDVDCINFEFDDSDEFGSYTTICYIVPDDDMVFEFDFFVVDESDRDVIQEIMNTLQKK